MSADTKPAAKPGKETIYVDVDDDITTIIDKLEAAQSKVVALVLPKRATALQSIVNMRLLARNAKNAGKNPVLITGEQALMPLAGAAGLHVAKSLQSKPGIPAGPAGPAKDDAPETETDLPAATDEEAVAGDALPNKIDYGKSIGELASTHEIDHPETIELDDEEEAVESASAATAKLPTKPPKDKRIKVPNFDRFRLWLGLGIAGFIALIVFIVLAVFVLPKAKLTIETTSTPVSASFTLNASDKAKALNLDDGSIPAVLKTADQTATQQVNATGQQNNGEKAAGSVVISRGACSGTVPGDVPAGTGVSTGGLTYITQKSASFTPIVEGSSCTFKSGTIPITAQTGGAKYNIGTSTFSVSGYAGASASGSASGGTDNNVTIVSQTDIDGAKQKITSAESDKFSRDFQKKLEDEGNYILTSTLKLSDAATTSAPAVGQPASTASVNIKITYTVLTVRKDDLKKAVDDAVVDQIDKTKQKIEASETLKGVTVSIANQTSPTTAILNVGVDGAAVPILDVNAIKKQIKGKKKAAITSEITNIQGVKSVNIKFSPFWVSKVPDNPSKVTIILKHVPAKTQ